METSLKFEILEAAFSGIRMKLIQKKVYGILELTPWIWLNKGTEKNGILKNGIDILKKILRIHNENSIS